MVEPASLSSSAMALLLLLRGSTDAVAVDPSSWCDDLHELEHLELVVVLGERRSHTRLTLAGRVMADHCATWDALASDDETLEARVRRWQLEQAVDD